MTAAHMEMYRQMTEHSYDLDSRIDGLRKLINELEEAAPPPPTHVSRIAQYENRLHDLLQRFNQTVACNSELKDSIDLLRKEKDTYEGIKNRVVNELEHTSIETNAVVEKSKAAYAARDNAKSQTEQLKQQADREHIEFQREWQELAKLLENDKRMREFVQQREIQKKLPKKTPSNTHRELVAKNAPDLTNRAKSQTVRKEELEFLFETVRAATGIRCLDELVQYFIEKEKSNYSLFALSSLNLKQVDSIQTRTKYITSEMERFRLGMHSSITMPGYQYVDSPPTTASSASKRDVGNLEQNLVSAERESGELEIQAKSLTKLISSIRAIVQSSLRRVFPEIDYCLSYLSQSVIATSAGQKGVPLGQVTESNLVDYLACIEMRVDELVAQYVEVFPQTNNRGGSIKKSFAVRGSQRKSLLALPSAAVAATGNSGNPVVMNRILQYKLPSATDDDQESVSDASKFREDVGVDTTRPLTRDELRSRTLMAIQRSQEKLRVKKSHSKLG